MISADDERAAIIPALVRWLEDERVNAVSDLRANGVALTKRIQRTFGERTHTHTDNSMEWGLVKTHHEEVDIFPYARLAMKWASFRWPATTPSPFASAGESDSHKKTREGLEAKLLGDYLVGLRNISEPDPVLAMRLANDYVDYLLSAQITAIEEVEMAGIVPPPTIVVSSNGTTSIRALTPEELGNNVRRMAGFPEEMSNDDILPLGFMFEGVHNIIDYVSGCMMTVRSKVARADAIAGEPRSSQVALAFQLLGYSLWGPGIVLRWTTPGPRNGSPPHKIQLPKHPEFPERAISTADLDEAVALAELVPPTFSTPKNPQELSLNQFSNACAHASDADAVIGFAIALDGVFVPGLRGESSYRFRLNGARYLGTNAEERRAIYLELKNLYEMRSKLVHGAPPKEDEVREWRIISRRYASRALIKALRHGWPTGSDFETSALS
jgi:hypothetical protein